MLPVVRQAHVISSETVRNAQVVELKPISVEKTAPPEDSDLQDALDTISQAADLMNRMQTRCQEREAEAQSLVHEARQDLAKAESEITILRQELKASEEMVSDVKSRLHTSEVTICDLELKLLEANEQIETAGASLSKKVEAFKRLQSAVKDQFQQGMNRLEAMQKVATLEAAHTDVSGDDRIAQASML